MILYWMRFLVEMPPLVTWKPSSAWEFIVVSTRQIIHRNKNVLREHLANPFSRRLSVSDKSRRANAITVSRPTDLVNVTSTLLGHFFYRRLNDSSGTLPSVSGAQESLLCRCCH